MGRKKRRTHITFVAVDWDKAREEAAVGSGNAALVPGAEGHAVVLGVKGKREDIADLGRH